MGEPRLSSQKGSSHYLPPLDRRGSDTPNGDTDQPLTSSQAVGGPGPVFRHLAPSTSTRHTPPETNSTHRIQGLLVTWNAATSEVPRSHSNMTLPIDPAKCNGDYNAPASGREHLPSPRTASRVWNSSRATCTEAQSFLRAPGPAVPGIPRRCPGHRLGVRVGVRKRKGDREHRRSQPHLPGGHSSWFQP